MKIDEAYAAKMRERNAERKKHGTFGMYKRGCRCAACSKRNARACREYAETIRKLQSFKSIARKEAA